MLQKLHLPVAVIQGNCALRRWAGLIRGAVSVALVYYYFDPKGQSEDSHRATLIATTLVVVMFSITVFGAITKPLLDFTLGMGEGGRGGLYSLISLHLFPNIIRLL